MTVLGVEFSLNPALTRWERGKTVSVSVKNLRTGSPDSKAIHQLPMANAAICLRSVPLPFSAHFPAVPSAVAGVPPIFFNRLFAAEAKGQHEADREGAKRDEKRLVTITTTT